MPKKPHKSHWGGQGWSNNSETKSYFGHDDRTSHSSDRSKFSNTKPRVSFKKQNYKQDRTKKNYMTFPSDGDEPMINSYNNSLRPMSHRGRGRGFNNRGRNSPLPRRACSRDDRAIFHASDSHWYKVFIPRGQKYTKEFVIGNLNSCIAPFTFTPIMYKIDGIDASFFVDDQKAALKIADCSNRITTNDGFKMYFKVKQTGSPPLEINDALKDRLKQAMNKRYVQETNALNLSKFYHDPDLAEDYWCPLSKQNMLMTILDIIQEHIPHLEALNLDSNKLHNIEKLSLLASKFVKLKILYIRDNKIKEMSNLNALKNLHLEELRLEGNPFCIKYKNRQDEFVSGIRKMFPKLLRLDDMELPPAIVFDLDDQKNKLPSTHRMFIVQSNTNAKELASRFLQQYFLVFDSSNRQSLLEAYHEQACFSLTTNISQNLNKFNPYLLETRNLLKVLDTPRRRKLLKQGRLPVVSFISEMPRTKHDLNSFTMDLSVFSEKMMFVTVTGLFQEYHNNDKLLRYFNRTFVIVPEGAGFCISNEQLHISNPTVDQEKQFDTSLSVQGVPGPSCAVPLCTISSIDLSEEVKQQMTITLSQQTKMNIEWSLKCLEDVQWNFESAQSAFQKAYSLGQIPSNAFTQ
ncbi:nuclear RNA export factor 1 [Copidosoma floridanum]|uniref:nuclear RNA export factor 1 n=1 Tax=Copidosoma floridanum TaxID=29053 RepID=UPI0006C96FE2|nr:nuclear RNA export factor 1 [Copidosoma floridanum]XP_014209249.1 nuclear RNA export factor 1 [Copidosoma floridanum]